MKYAGICKGGPCDGKRIELDRERFWVVAAGPDGKPPIEATAPCGSYDFDKTTETWVWTPPA